MAKNKYFFIFLIFTCNHFLQAQDNRFVVYFTDKPTTGYSLNAPEEFLSERAIQRRIDQNIPITVSDIPVNEAYIDSLKENGIEVYHRSRWLNAVLIQTDSAKLTSLEKFSFIKDIVYVAPGTRLKPSGNIKSAPETSGVPQSRSSNQNEIIPLDQNVMMGVPQMHEQGFMGQGMLVGVFDGGFLKVNELEAFAPLYEENRIAAAKNFVVNSDDVYQYSDHGTRALSVIGGYLPATFIGTAPKANFILCVTEDVSGEYRIEEYNWLFAAEYADSAGVDIINTSLGYNSFSDSTMNYSYGDLNGRTAIITRASAIAAGKGIVLVTSAGNEGEGPWKYISAPADADSILAVGAVFKEGYEKVPFSSIGPTADGRIKPDVAALGYRVSSINRTGDITPANGTSFAAPLVTGLVAGFWQANPTLGNIEVIERIKMSGHRSSSPNNNTGHGVPHFARAMEEAILKAFQKEVQSFRAYPNPVIYDQINIELATGRTAETFTIFLYDSAGKMIREMNVQDHHTAEVLNLDLEDLRPGIYIINLVTSKTSEAVKIVKF